MVDLLHQCQETTDLAVRKALAGKPVEIMTGQIGNQATFIFAVGHGAGNQEQEVLQELTTSIFRMGEPLFPISLVT